MTIIVDHDQRKALILECAFELFAEEGFQGVTYQKIADKCKISRTSIYKYFQSKEQIFDYAVKQATGKMEVIVQRIRERKDWTPLEKLRRFLHVLVKMLAKNHVFLTVVLKYLLSERQAGNDIQRKIRRHTFGIKFLLSRLLSDAMRNGELVPADVSMTTNHLYGMMESLVLNIAVTDMLTWRNAIAMVDGYFELLKPVSVT
ncbi:MAG: TetR/AcrR family transcriptional regulator [Planctomycetaceae bacterium]|nr:TetR/AcrR family transcriptional regulator [Planctomycetaceae bacterium]